MTKFLEQYREKEPISIFREWFKEAKSCGEVKDHTEVCLATACKEGRPSNRIVLLKDFDERGFVFFTNYTGRKSKEIEENPHASLCFYWPPLGKQIRIEGDVEMINAKESNEYFASRPRESQLGAWTSKQSATLESYKKFEEELQNTREKFKDTDIPRPDFWGGWRVKPYKIEFWKAEDYRFHHRLLFQKNLEHQWESKELYP